jgi:hypothetical protein
MKNREDPIRSRTRQSSGDSGQRPKSGDFGYGSNLIDCYEVVIECGSEDAQRELFDELRRRGYECRLLVL